MNDAKSKKTTQDYARWFRGSTPYIRAHRDKTFVVLLPGEALDHVNLTNIVHDLALLHVLGVRLVLVHGARPQIEAALDKDGSRYHAHRRITDTDAMQSITAVYGQIRAKLEALFSTGVPNSPLHKVEVPVISGNFVSAKPIGIIDGVDHLLTGSVRKIHTQRVETTLANGAILLLSPIGYSSSGQSFNLPAEELAAEVAIQVGADKLLVFNEMSFIENTDGSRISTLTATGLEGHIEHLDAQQHARLRCMPRAVRGGVGKAQLVSFTEDGALLAELFTAEGVGTQIMEQQRQRVRQANSADVAGIVEMIRPLEEAGTLVRRERDRLEQEIEHFWVAELDGIVVGCCAIYPFDQHAELACVAVHENYRQQSGLSLGQSLLEAAEQHALTLGANKLFVLTTQTRDWFVEHGFSEASIETLPTAKQSLYNWQRNSIVLTKPLALK